MVASNTHSSGFVQSKSAPQMDPIKYILMILYRKALEMCTYENLSVVLNSVSSTINSVYSGIQWNIYVKPCNIPLPLSLTLPPPPFLLPVHRPNLGSKFLEMIE